MRQLVTTLVLLSLTVSAQAAGFDQTVWDSLLKKHAAPIHNGLATQVDYGGMNKDHALLKQYLDATSHVSRTTFDGWDKHEQLAFLINAYNAWTVELILTKYPNLESIKDLGSFFSSPWKKRFIPLLGKTRTLDDIEHKLIRGSGRYNEPRIHFAVNCASIGCPALRPEAYTGARLEQQLEQATRNFLSDRSRNYLKGDTLYLSPIFKWYREDFEQGWLGSKRLPDFLLRYRQALALDDTATRQLAAGKIDIEFLDYNWKLNRTP